MKTHAVGIYPMYHKESNIKTNKIGEVVSLDLTLSHIDKIEIGDIYCHKTQGNKFKVIDILEERPAKGRHPKPATFYHLRLSK